MGNREPDAARIHRAVGRLHVARHCPAHVLVAPGDDGRAIDQEVLEGGDVPQLRQSRGGDVFAVKRQHFQGAQLRERFQPRVGDRRVAQEKAADVARDGELASSSMALSVTAVPTNDRFSSLGNCVSAATP